MSSASASVQYQPNEKLNTSLSIVYTDFFKDDTGEKVYEYTIGRARTTYQLNKYLFFRGIAEYNNYYKTLQADFLASFTYIPGTVIHLGYGSIFQKTEWRESILPPNYYPSDKFHEMTRGIFFKASYLWRM